MNLFVFDRPKFDRLYNCGYDVDVIPLESRRDVPHGLFHIAMFVLLEAIYLPCLWVIWRNEKLRTNSCYRLMLALGVCGTCGMVATGLAAGYYFCVGAVFCTNPVSIAIAGTAGLGLWYAEMQISILLAVNRCMIICRPTLADALFKCWRTDAWIVGIFALAFVLTTSAPFITFNSVRRGWYFNPHLGYLNGTDSLFENHVQPMFNSSVCVTLFTVYVVFGLSVLVRLRHGWTTAQSASAEAAAGGPDKAGSRRRTMSTAEYLMFIQIMVISVLAGISAFGYVLQNIYSLHPLLLYAIAFAYILFQGIPPILYLCLNRTIRREVLALMSPLGRPRDVSDIGGTSQIDARYGKSDVFSENSAK